MVTHGLAAPQVRASLSASPSDSQADSASADSDGPLHGEGLQPKRHFGMIST